MTSRETLRNSGRSVFDMTVRRHERAAILWASVPRKSSGIRMRRVQLVLGAFIVTAVTVGTAPVFAQGTGTIRGRVTAQNTQQGLVGALVTFRNRSVYTRDDGTYLIT